MKVLKIAVSGLPLFSDGCEISFLASQRASKEKSDCLGYLFSIGNLDIFKNNVVSCIGINASGKTSILRLVTFVLKMLNMEILIIFLKHHYFRM